MQATAPLVSIIIPTYNRLPFLLEAVDSIVKQTYKNWELIIVDDGSTDNTIEKINALLDERISITSLVHKGHIGILRNEGVKRSRGSWISFLDSDDLWVHDKLERQLNHLYKENKTWCYSNWELIDDNGTTLESKAGTFKPLAGIIAEDVISFKTGVSISTIILQKNLFDELGGFSTDERLLYRGDLEFLMRLSAKAEASVVPDILLRLREHGSRVTNSLNNPHERTALAFEVFMKSGPPVALAKLAEKEIGRLKAEACVEHLTKGNFGKSMKLLAVALSYDRGYLHLLKAQKRQILAKLSFWQMK